MPESGKSEIDVLLFETAAVLFEKTSVSKKPAIILNCYSSSRQLKKRNIFSPAPNGAGVFYAATSLNCYSSSRQLKKRNIFSPAPNGAGVFYAATRYWACFSIGVSTPSLRW